MQESDIFLRLDMHPSVAPWNIYNNTKLAY